MLKREFYKRAKGPIGNDEDWWRLVFDTDTNRLYVEHEWSYLDTRRLRCDGGKAELEIADFFNQSAEGPAHQELVKLISSLFESQPDDRK
jgi:hypothetical protein